ncbi:DNA alkylation repair protein [Catenulispora yoronensis]
MWTASAPRPARPTTSSTTRASSRTWESRSRSSASWSRASTRTWGRRAGHDEVTGLAAALWDSDVYERRLAAVFVLAQGVRLLGAPDLQDVTLMLRDAPMWSLVDPLSGDVAGKVALRDREGSGRTLDLWADDGDFWLRRASLLALIPGIREGRPDLVRFTRYADPMVEEREFFIRKAIGWVLREIAYKDPTWVAAWVTARLDRMAGVTFREAVRRLPAETAERLTAEYKAAGAGRNSGKALVRAMA